MLANDKVLAKFEANSGNSVTLTPAFIKDVIAKNQNVTDEELLFFAANCKAHRIDPTIKEAYLIKYGDAPAQMVVGKDYYSRVADRNPNYDGCECGITVLVNGNIERREGSMFSENQEQLIGGWCRVWRKDRSHPFYDEVSFAEYSTGKSMWKMPSQGGKPGTQIRKVAYVHAHREAFPEEFSGLYDSAEMGVEVPSGQQPEVVQAEVIEAETLQERGAEIIEEYANGARDQYYEEEVVF